MNVEENAGFIGRNNKKIHEDAYSFCISEQ
jgi:hypothetical protein